MGALTPELMEDVTSQSLILNILAFANSPQRNIHDLMVTHDNENGINL